MAPLLVGRRRNHLAVTAEPRGLDPAHYAVICLQAATVVEVPREGRRVARSAPFEYRPDFGGAPGVFLLALLRSFIVGDTRGESPFAGMLPQPFAREQHRGRGVNLVQVLDKGDSPAPTRA